MTNKRRWLRFSLRTLIAAMTLAGIASGWIGRAISLERRARLHDSEYMRLTDWERPYPKDSIEHDAQWHKQAADTCRRAMFRPWTTAFAKYDTSDPRFILSLAALFLLPILCGTIIGGLAGRFVTGALWGTLAAGALLLIVVLILPTVHV